MLPFSRGKTNMTLPLAQRGFPGSLSCEFSGRRRDEESHEDEAEVAFDRRGAAAERIGRHLAAEVDAGEGAEARDRGAEREAAGEDDRRRGRRDARGAGPVS